MTAESGGSTVLGKQVSDLQSDVSVGTNKITGTLNYNEGWESGSLEGPGHYIALKFSSSDWSQYDSVKVGLDPSIGTGLVEVKDNPDHNGVFKITNKATQKFVIEARADATVSRKEWSLAELVLQDEPTPTVDSPIEVPETITVYNSGGSSVTLADQNVTLGELTKTTIDGVDTYTYDGNSGTIASTTLGFTLDSSKVDPEMTGVESVRCKVGTGSANPVMYADGVASIGIDNSETVEMVIYFLSSTMSLVKSINVKFINSTITQA